MKKKLVCLGTMPFNGEPSKVWLLLGTIFIASSIVRKRVQIDIACDENDPRTLNEDEKEKIKNLDLSI